SNQPGRRLVIRKQWGGQHKQRRFVRQFAACKIAFLCKIAGFSMPFDRDPIIQGLKWKIRIRCRLDFNNDEPPSSCDREQIDDVPFLTNKAGDLWVDVPNIDRRQQLADLANEVGLQPALLVSARKWMPASIPPGLSDFFDNVDEVFAERISRACAGH